MKATQRNLALPIVWLMVLLGFVGLAIRAATGGLLAADLSIAKAVQDLPEAAGQLFQFENWLGSTAPLIAVTLMFAVALFLRGSREGAALTVLTFLPRAADVIIKVLVDEPRPSPGLIRVDHPPDNLSFPSGHVIGVTLVFGLMLAFAPRVSRSRPTIALVRGVCVLLIATIGLARVWIGAHWPSDALGGYLYALIFLIPAFAWYRCHASGGAAVSQAR